MSGLTSSLIAGSPRRYRIVVGLATLLFLATLTIYSVKIRVGGNPRDYYQIEGTFSSAGQGLIAGSDVKVHGVDIGRVRNVRLIDGRARVRMDIKRSCGRWPWSACTVPRQSRVPAAARATIRPKTLFGEKFIDIDPGETEIVGPWLTDEQSLSRDATVGGFELEQVLVDLYPLLKAVKPEELATVLDELAKAGDGKGAQINRVISLSSKAAHDQAGNDAQLDEFLRQLAVVSEELVVLAPVVLDLADDLNATLPDLNKRGAELGRLLDESARLSGDLDALLRRNRPFIDKAVTQGGKTLQQLFNDRESIGPLITGLRQFFQVLGSIGHIDYGDGTKLAAVKFVLNSECPQARFTCGERLTLDGHIVPAATANASSAKGPKPATTVPSIDGIGPIVPKQSDGAQAIVDLLLPTLGGRR
jgi:phospholipid/cholesterol/gamma-HCH transport system substrate-binding protein